MRLLHQSQVRKPSSPLPGVVPLVRGPAATVRRRSLDHGGLVFPRFCRSALCPLHVDFSFCPPLVIHPTTASRSPCPSRVTCGPMWLPRCPILLAIGRSAQMVSNLFASSCLSPFIVLFLSRFSLLKGIRLPIPRTNLPIDTLPLPFCPPWSPPVW